MTNAKTSAADQRSFSSRVHPCARRKPEVLRGKKNFERVFRYGKRIDGRVLRCLFLIESHLSQASCGSSVAWGVAVSRSIRRAVVRNRIKRLIREAYRLNKRLVPAQRGDRTSTRLTLVFVYGNRTTNETMEDLPTFHEIVRDIVYILTTLARMSHLQVAP